MKIISEIKFVYWKQKRVNIPIFVTQVFWSVLITCAVWRYLNNIFRYINKRACSPLFDNLTVMYSICVVTCRKGNISPNIFSQPFYPWTFPEFIHGETIQPRLVFPWGLYQNICSNLHTGKHQQSNKTTYWSFNCVHQLVHFSPFSVLFLFAGKLFRALFFPQILFIILF